MRRKMLMVLSHTYEWSTTRKNSLRLRDREIPSSPTKADDDSEARIISSDRVSSTRQNDKKRATGIDRWFGILVR